MRRAIVLLPFLLVALAILGFQTGAYLEFRNLVLGNPSVSDSSHHGGSNTNSSSGYIETNTIINYGNSTVVWYNHTRSPSNWNFYNLTVHLTNGNVQSIYYSSYGAHQILGINGLEQSAIFYWSLWKFCPTHNAWDWSTVGVDRISLSSNGVYGWRYEQQLGPQIPPITGAQTEVALDINSC